MFLPVKMGELWPSCGRVVPSIGRVVAELLGEIVKFRQLAQKRLGGHLCLGGGKTPIFLRHFDFFGFTCKVPANHRKFRVRDGFGVWFGGVL